MRKARPHRIPTTLLLVLVALGGCKLIDGPVEDEASRSGFAGTSASDDNSVPFIWGDPETAVLVNTQYQFTPESDDADGDVLEYAVVNKPAWADFDIYSGSLQGVPDGDDVGVHRNIVVSVTDGNSVVSLPSFAIDVQSGSGDGGGSSGDGDTGGSDGGGSDGGGDTGDTGDDGDTGDTGDTGGDGDTGDTGDTGDDGGDAGGSDDGDGTSGASSPPSISGEPNEAVVVDKLYSFQPDASDPDGDDLSFSIVNRPSWASFDTASGRLEGRPGQADIGTTDSIGISVTDGTSIAALNDFAITVEPVPTASYTVSWVAPTENEDGTALTDLAGYRIYYGTSAGNYAETIEIAAGLTSYMIDDLTPGTYYLVMTSINSLEMESKKTPELEFQP